MRLQLASIILLASMSSSAQQSLNVAFFGNSYTASNSLPNLVEEIALAQGDTLHHFEHVPGGYTMEGHWNDRSVLVNAMNNSGPFDYVVIQGQSQRPSFSPSQVANEVLPYAQNLDSLIKSIDSCTQTAFFMTWGRENGDQLNCPFYPPICTYEGMQDRLKSSYKLMARDNDAITVPVGESWRLLRDSVPGLQLYTSDGSHPSLRGSYLAAFTFYTSLFNKPVLDTQLYNTQIPPHEYLFMQWAANKAVYDSLGEWGIDTTRIEASFSDSISRCTAYFRVDNPDSSARYVWAIQHVQDTIYGGDTLVYEFTLPGTYRVWLTVTKGCQTATYHQDVELGVHDPCNVGVADSRHNYISFNIIDRELIKLKPLNRVEIYNVTGQPVLFDMEPTSPIDLRHLPQGIYLVTVSAGDDVRTTKIYLGQ